MLAESSEEILTTENHLKVADRCDRCGARAFVLVKGISGELMFCGHHFAKHEKALVQYAYEIIDERDNINQKGGASE